VAENVAQTLGVDLHEIPVRGPDALGAADLLKNLDDAVSYYDGRTNATMGSAGDAHTRALRVTALGGKTRVGLSGLGGEILRNRENLPKRRFPFRGWFSYFILGPASAVCLAHSPRGQQVADRLAHKHLALSGCDREEGWDRFKAREYFLRVWLPSTAGVRSMAENMLSFFLLPLADHEVVERAVALNAVLGPGGALEAELICRHNLELAAVPSQYGFAFDRIRLWDKAKWFALSQLPHTLRLRYGRARIEQQLGASGRGRQAAAMEQMGALCGVLDDIGLDFDWRVLLVNRASRDRMVFICHFLKKISENIEW